MAHPLLRTRSRVLTSIGLAGALLVPAAPAVGLSVDTTIEAVDQTCEHLTDAVELLEHGCDVPGDVAGEAGAPVTDAVDDALEMATESAEEPVDDTLGAVDAVVDPATEEVGAVTDPVADEAPPAEDPGGEPARPADGSAGRTPDAAPEADDGAAVEAAGKEPVEVAAPQAPAAGDGRVAAAPGIRPSGLGANAPGVASESGLTMQPYEAPIVSVPAQGEPPSVAGAPVTTASPVAAMAGEAMTFAGDVVLPYTSGAAGWVTAAGLGLLGAAGFAMRRRWDSSRLEPIEE